MILGLVTLLPGVRPERPGEAEIPVLFTVGVVVLFGGLTVWLALKMYRGRNWARWTMLAYLALGWWLAGSEMQDNFVRSPISAVIDVICIAMEAVACWLVTLGDGARWFSRGISTRR